VTLLFVVEFVEKWRDCLVEQMEREIVVKEETIFFIYIQIEITHLLTKIFQTTTSEKTKVQHTGAKNCFMFFFVGLLHFLNECF
jgi:hypothetical protein